MQVQISLLEKVTVTLTEKGVRIWNEQVPNHPIIIGKKLYTTVWSLMQILGPATSNSSIDSLFGDEGIFTFSS